MRNLLLLFIIVACATSTVRAQFRLASDGFVSQVSNPNDSTYVVDVNLFSDLTGSGYSPTNITTAYRVFSQRGQLYRIAATANLTFGSARLTLVEIDNEQVNTEGLPIGQVQVFDPGTVKAIPQVPFSTSGSGAVLQSAVVSYNSLIPAGEGGGVTALQLADSTQSAKDYADTATINLERIVDIEFTSNSIADRAYTDSREVLIRSALLDTAAAIRLDIPAGVGGGLTDSQVRAITSDTATAIRTYTDANDAVIEGDVLTNTQAIADLPTDNEVRVIAGDSARASVQYNNSATGIQAQDFQSAIDAIAVSLQENTSLRLTGLGPTISPYTKNYISPATSPANAAANVTTYTGSQGDNYFIVAANGYPAAINYAVAVSYGLPLRYKSFIVQRSNVDTLFLYEALDANYSGSLSVMLENNSGQHLTEMGYLGLADFVFDQPRYKSEKTFYIDAFLPEQAATTIVPFTLYGDIQTGGVLAGTDNNYIPRNQIRPLNISHHNHYSRAYSFAQKGVQKGGRWQVNTGEIKGYVEAYIGCNNTISVSDASTIYPDPQVLVYLYDPITNDTILKDTVYAELKHVVFPFEKRTDLVFGFHTMNDEPTEIQINRVIWRKADAKNDLSILDGYSKGIILGDSWSTFYDTAFANRIETRMQETNPLATFTSVGKAGQTSAWGRYWFDSLVINSPLGKPDFVIIEFFTNDRNSNAGGTSWNFDGANPYGSGTDQPGAVTPSQWAENIQYMIDRAIENGIQPITLLDGHTASITQAQEILVNYANQIGAGKRFFSGGIANISQSVSTGTINAATVELTEGLETPVVYADSIVGKSIGQIGTSIIIQPRDLNAGSSKSILFKPVATRTGGDFLRVENFSSTTRIYNFGWTGSLEANDFISYRNQSGGGFRAGLNGEFQMAYYGSIAYLRGLTPGNPIALLRIGENIPYTQFVHEVDMEQNKIVDLGTPTNPSDAAPKSYVDAQVAAGAADNLGNHIATQNINFNSFKGINLGAPTAATDAATKAYVDANAGGGASADQTYETVAYATPLVRAYDPARPNFQVVLTGDIDLNVTSATGGSGYVNLTLTAGTENVLLQGTPPANTSYPTGAGDVLRFRYAFESDGLKWYYEGEEPHYDGFTATVGEVVLENPIVPANTGTIKVTSDHNNPSIQALEMIYSGRLNLGNVNNNVGALNLKYAGGIEDVTQVEIVRAGGTFMLGTTASGAPSISRSARVLNFSFLDDGALFSSDGTPMMQIDQTGVDFKVLPTVNGQPLLSGGGGGGSSPVTVDFFSPAITFPNGGALTAILDTTLEVNSRYRFDIDFFFTSASGDDLDVNVGTGTAEVKSYRTRLDNRFRNGNFVHKLDSGGNDTDNIGRISGYIKTGVDAANSTFIIQAAKNGTVSAGDASIQQVIITYTKE